jgi:cytochrome c nitrite reductase small subunit
MSDRQPTVSPGEDKGAAVRGVPDRKHDRRYLWTPFVVLLGMCAGLGVYTFGYGKGASYLKNDPSACANCHVMQEHFDTWQQSSHHHVATCNDCHLPHNPVGKLVVEADNGFFHSLAFTLQDYHDPIQIKPRNRVVAQNACLSCHGDLVHCMLPAASTQGAMAGEILLCVHCHADVGHAFRGISSRSRRE